MHSLEDVQASPAMPRGRHMPPMHCAPTSQSASVAHDIAHMEPGEVGCDIEEVQKTLG